MTYEPPEERLAREPDLPGMSFKFRERLFEATADHLRRRRVRARIVRLSSLAGAFAAGMLVMFAATPRVPTPIDPVSGFGTSDGVTTAENSPAGTQSPASEDLVFDDPEALAFAFDAADHNGRMDLLKAAGDHELSVNSDIRAALDYYRQWIDLADTGARKNYDETDTWLLASLKHTP